MTAPWSFGQCGPILEANDFQPIPISRPHKRDVNLGKKPPGSLDEWPKPAPVASRLPRYAGCGTGILTETTPAVDIDVRHAELADAIERMVIAEIGDGPVRYGQAPKRLRPCRTDQPFPKIATRNYRLLGDEPGAKAHKLEILGDGQQFVAFGDHPDTGLPYSWPFDSLIDLERDDLPELTAEAAASLVAKAETMLARIGTAVSTVGNGRTKPRTAFKDGVAPRPVRDLTEAHRVFDTLKAIDPSELDYDTWIKVGYGLRAALGDRGESLWLAWSRASARHDGTFGERGTPERAWRGIKPELCGWRYLERIHGELVADRLLSGGQTRG
jgi:putative DNA primase/helicase